MGHREKAVELLSVLSKKTNQKYKNEVDTVCEIISAMKATTTAPSSTSEPTPSPLSGVVQENGTVCECTALQLLSKNIEFDQKTLEAITVHLKKNISDKSLELVTVLLDRKILTRDQLHTIFNATISRPDTIADTLLSHPSIIEHFGGKLDRELSKSASCSLQIKRLQRLDELGILDTGSSSGAYDSALNSAHDVYLYQIDEAERSVRCALKKKIDELCITHKVGDIRFILRRHPELDIHFKPYPAIPARKVATT